MKYTLSLLILLLISFFIACEKDDICVDETANTSNLIIEFIDIAPPNELSPVTDLLIVGDGNALSYGVQTTTSSISIPLKVFDTTTTYRLIKEYGIDDNGTPADTSDDIVLGNEDEIIISYTNEQVYISRACGFKNVYNNVAVINTADTDNWILNVEVLVNTIENGNETHVYIYH